MNVSLIGLLRDIVFKYGGPGVMFLWLLSVQYKLWQVEDKLYECLETRTKIQQSYQLPYQDSNEDRIMRIAILPRDEFKIISK